MKVKEVIMSDKILFLIDLWFFHFGLARSLQNKGDYDMYVVYDIDKKAREFFENQNIVKFTKSWFYTDFVKTETKQPDMKYLKEFEKKYNINLWQIAYTDRTFFQYNKFHKFSENEILFIIEQECKFFEKILDEINPDFYACYLTITHYQELFRQLCKAKGIKILMMTPTKMGKKITISEEDSKIDYLDLQEKSISKFETNNDLEKYLETINPFKHIQEIKKIAFDSNKLERYKSILKYYFSASDKDYQLRYANIGRTKIGTTKEKINRFLNRKKISRFLDKNTCKEIEQFKPFIYFPLHYEPERFLLITSPFFDNQLSVLTNVAKSIPVEYTLVVKEHPFMKTIGWREPSYYKSIIDLPNVKLVHPSVPPNEIVKKSSLVITLGGTAGLEASFYNKPCIIFTDTIYSKISSVFKLEKIEELPDLIRKCLEIKIEKNNMNEFIEIIHNNSFELEIGKISTDFAFTFGLKGLIMDEKLPETKIVKFLDKYSEVFELLAHEHIKKINLHKKNKK